MEELKEQIIKLALFYADTLLNLDKGYSELKQKLSKGTDTNLLDKSYEMACDENLRMLTERAEKLAKSVCSTLDELEDDLK